MKLFNRVTYNKLMKLGFNSEQIVAILASTNASLLLDVINVDFTNDDIRSISKFINKHNTFVSDIKNIDYEKKMLIVRSYNSIENIPVSNNLAIWNFIVDIANNYDVNILKVTIEKLLNNNPDMDFVSLVKNAIDQNVDLHDLSCFKRSKTKIK